MKPLSAQAVVAQQKSLKEPYIVDEFLVWLEQRPEEHGRTTLLVRPWGCSELHTQELTPSPINVRTRVHEYGGGSFNCSSWNDEIFFSWIDDNNGCLYYQSFQKEDLKEKFNNSIWLKNLGGVRCLSKQSSSLLADGQVDIKERRWYGIMEEKGQDFLVTFSLDSQEQLPQIIYKPKDFMGYLSFNNDYSKLVWIEWEYPYMPWDSSQLWLADINREGELENINLIAGNSSLDSNQISVFQPIWMNNGKLLVSEDSSSWWNLMITNDIVKDNKLISWKHLWPMKAETAMPQWVYGMSTTSVAGQKILSANCSNGRWKLNLLSEDGSGFEINQPFDDISGLNVQGSRAVAIVSNSKVGSGLLELDLTSFKWTHTPANKILISKDQISQPEDFWFKGYLGENTHGLFYSPTNPIYSIPPLLVKIHSGPTSMARSGLNLEIQFWTSRGWAVLDVNYGGSSGFGRKYRERLKYKWGKTDVCDCVFGAEALIQTGKADKNRIAIDGGSAGGFTALLSLCEADVFKVASCRYAVTDLIGMIKDTHRFESGYLEYLIGASEENFELYKDRSPLYKAEKINCPIVFFQGLQDKVVLPSQTERIASILTNKNIPVEINLFENEGHGFKDSNVKHKVLIKTEEFFNKHLNL